MKTQNFIASVLKAGVAISFTLFLAACGGDSGNNGRMEVVGDGSISTLPHYGTFDDLPNCSGTREDSVAVTENDNVAHKCLDGRWETLGEPFEKEDDLPNCTPTRNGQSAYVLDVNKKFSCSDGRWNAASDTSSKDGGKSPEGGKSSEGGESAGDEGSLDSGDVFDENSSNSEKGGEVNQSASSNQVIQTGCENTSSTTLTAGPKSLYGDFGYVLPLKVTSGNTQELYLAFDTAYTGINGPSEWSEFGAMIARYDSKNGQWIPGTEIFSKSIKSATIMVGSPTVNTYGAFEKFDFTTKGTWLENNIGKTVDVVVNFYAPGVESDESGMGLDYYSIPSKHPVLYYSYEATSCTKIVKGAKKPFDSCEGTLSNGSDATGVYNEIYLGDVVKWSLKAYSELETLNKYVTSLKWSSNIGSLDSQKDYSFFVSYLDLGETHDTIEVTFMGNKFKYACPTYGLPITKVVPQKVTGCKCTADVEEIDVTEGGTATWTVSGCQSKSPITTYEWIGATKKTNTTATYTFAEKGKVSPTVKVTNEDGGSATVTCPAVKGIDLSSIDYLFDRTGMEGAVNITAGEYQVGFNLPVKTGGGCYHLYCNTNGSGDAFSIESPDFRIQAKDYFVTIELPSQYCGDSYDVTMIFSIDMACYVEW